MTTRSTKSLLIGAMASLALALGVTEADAQIFETGDASTYRTPTTPGTNGAVIGGTIRMRSSQGEIKGKYGKSEANRMPGVVIWYCKSTIPGGTFFTDLGTGGGDDVTVGPGTIDIAGDYKPNGDNQGGTRTYPDGTNIKLTGNDPNKPQTIPGENTTNGGGFDVVTLEGNGPKQTLECGTGDVVIKQLVHTGATLTNKGNLTLANKAGAPHSAKDIINEVPAAGNCGITLAGGATLGVENYTNTSGFWKLEENSNVNLSGNFTYTAGKMDFACNSNFHYMGGTAQTITATPGTVDTDDFYSYGNILFSNSEKTAAGNFNVCNNIRTESEVKLVTYTANLLNKTPGNHVFFNLADGTAETDVEIEGNLQYTSPKAGEALTFNNKHTKVTFEESNSLTSFALFVKGATAPTEATPINPVEDVTRKINVTYTGSGTISHFETMWEAGDELNGFVAPTPGTPIRFAEGYDASQERKKIIRVGATYNNDVANRIIKYGKDGTAQGIFLDAAHNPTTAPTDPNQLVTFNQKLASGSDILLSTKTQKAVSVVNGRWSNPATWDTGLEPASNDDVEIRTTVWVGDHNALFGGSAFEGNERAITNADQTDGSQFAARSISIENVPGAGLYVNMVDPDLAINAGTKEIVFKTHMVGAADKVGIFNKNTAQEVENPGANGNMNGIYLSAVTNDRIPVLGAANWNNLGTFTNLGVAEVGECIP